MKKDRKAGYYGSLRAGVDTQGGWNTGGNINYSSGKLDAYANVGYRARQGGGGSLSEQSYLMSQTYQNYESENDNTGGNLFTRAGLTWYMTDKDELTIGGMAMFGNNENTSFTPYRYGTIGALTDSYIMHRKNSVEGDMNMYNAELGYIHKFGEKNMLTMNFSYHKWKSDNESYYQDSTLWLDGSQPTTYSYQYRPMHVDNNSWEARVDYENQITDNLKLEAGYNGRLSRENTPQESFSDNTSWNGANMKVDEDYYNRFIYDMDIHAFYATVNTKIGKLGVMAGLRGEYWKVNTESYNYEQEHDVSKRFEPFKKDFFELFPSLFLNYPITETAQIQLNYTRRMHRPWGGQLNNFKNTNDASMVTFGNPELTPEFSNSFTLNFLKTWENHSLSLGAYYRPTTDVIERVSYNVNDTMYSTSENLAKSQSAGVEIIGKNRLWMQAVLRGGLLQFLPSCVQSHIGLNGIGIQLPKLVTVAVNVPAGEAVAFPCGRLRYLQKFAVHLILGSHIGAALGIKGNGEAGVAQFQSNHYITIVSYGQPPVKISRYFRHSHKIMGIVKDS